MNDLIESEHASTTTTTTPLTSLTAPPPPTSLSTTETTTSSSVESSNVSNENTTTRSSNFRAILTRFNSIGQNANVPSSSSKRWKKRKEWRTFRKNHHKKKFFKKYNFHFKYIFFQYLIIKLLLSFFSYLKRSYFMFPKTYKRNKNFVWIWSKKSGGGKKSYLWRKDRK